MTEDAGVKLLAAVELLMLEVRGLRSEMREERAGREAAASLRRAAADRQARHRERSRHNNVTAGVGNGGSHVTDNVTVTLRAQVVKKEQDQKQVQEQLPAASRDSDVTSRDAWRAYSKAYFEKYQAEPVRNAKINGQIAQLVKRLGADTPLVAEFYLGHNAAFYVQQGHSVGMLLKDAEKLHMEWRTGKPINGSTARQLERSAANAEGWARAAKGG